VYQHWLNCDVQLERSKTIEAKGAMQGANAADYPVLKANEVRA
jgi:hypothetical protein